MNTYLVEVKTSGRELYWVDADSPEQAKESWPDGTLAVAETLDTEVIDVKINPT